MFDRILTMTFRNYATLMLVVASVVAPLQLVHASVFNNVIEVHELHDDIAGFPAAREVRGVSRGDVARWKATYIAVLALELLAIPLMAGAARRVLEVDAADGVPTAPDAWRRRRRARLSGVDAPMALMATAFGALVWWLTRLSLGRVAEMTPDTAQFVAHAGAETAAMSLGLPFLLTAIALGAKRAKTFEPELY